MMKRKTIFTEKEPRFSSEEPCTPCEEPAISYESDGILDFPVQNKSLL